MATDLTLDALRCYALGRSLFPPTTLPRAVARLGFVQADPIRAPARAQDLILRHRVKDYRAGDLERRYPRLGVEEDVFVNYGFVTSDLHALMHPRTSRTVWSDERWAQAQAVLDFVRARGVVHPREVDAHFDHGASVNWFGGSTRASTQLLDGLHFRGHLRVARRDSGTRLYAVREPRPVTTDPDMAMDALLDAVVALYAPLPERSLAELTSHLIGGVPQWQAHRASMLGRAKQRLAQATVADERWYWPPDEHPASVRRPAGPVVRLLAPFDPVVWDRRRFERFWGWAYRFEAYTPAAKRVRGYYALPLLWGDAVIGWANANVVEGALHLTTGYVAGAAPGQAAFRAALDEEAARLAVCLGAVVGSVR